MRPVPLSAATDERLFGGKAVSLGRALRAGLPVPDGLALSVPFVSDVANGHEGAVASLLSQHHITEERVAVRSSAVGEDSSDASFAGQHATHLNVRRHGLAEAVRAVWASGRTPGALAYRAQKGLPGNPAVAVVVQSLIEPVAAGVLFTRNPMTGADERLIEAGWGLGEAVVSGRIEPDHFRLDTAGRTLDARPGYKDVQILHHDHEGVVEVEVPSELREALCLTPTQLAALYELGERCRREWGPALDLEWAIGRDGRCYLLQSRPITTGGTGA